MEMKQTAHEICAQIQESADRAFERKERDPDFDVSSHIKEVVAERFGVPTSAVEVGYFRGTPTIKVAFVPTSPLDCIDLKFHVG